MSNVNGPRHAKQLLVNARGMIRRTLEWANDIQLRRDLARVNVDLTHAIDSLVEPARMQQAAERSQRETVRNR